MGLPLSVALEPGEANAPAGLEPWVTPDLLGYAHANQSVDLASVCSVATEILFLLSGRRYGVRTEKIRPIAGARDCGWQGLGSQWSAEQWLLGQYGLNAGAQDWVVLRSPVTSITEVKVDGQVLSSSDYVLYDNRKLVRLRNAQGIGQVWPLYQRLDLDDTQIGTFSITYSWGRAVPEGGKAAAQVFATELARYINKDACALPDRVVSVTRQGVSQTIIDPSQFLRESRTGLYLVDAWLGAVNPHGNRRRPVIASPDSATLVRPT